MKKLIKNVVEQAYRFRLLFPDGFPSGRTETVSAESEDAARLKLPPLTEEGFVWHFEGTE